MEYVERDIHTSVCMCVQSVCACTDVSEAEVDVGVFLYCSVASPWLLSTQQVKLSTGGDKRRGGQLAGLVLSGQCWAQQRPCSIYTVEPSRKAPDISLWSSHVHLHTYTYMEKELQEPHTNLSVAVLG